MNVKQKIPHRLYTGVRWRTNKLNKEQLIIDFEHKCAYCDDYDKYVGGSKVYHVEHFAPKEKFPELQFTYDNLLYACPYCNISKSNKWPSNNSDINVVENEGFVDPCTEEYNNHLERKENGSISYLSPVGEYMYYNLKLYLQRHQLIYNLGRVHKKLKDVREEIERREAMQKPMEDLKNVYKELCVVFYEYYDIFTEDMER